MKRYRITIEELPGGVSTDGTIITTTTTSTVSGLEDIAGGDGATEGEFKKVATTTATMPTGVVNWLLNVSHDKPYGFREPAVDDSNKVDETKVSALTSDALPVGREDDTVVAVVVPQVPLPGQDDDHATPTQVSSATAEVVVAEPETVATKIESPPVIAVPAAAAAAIDISALVAAAVDSAASSNSNNSKDAAAPVAAASAKPSEPIAVLSSSSSPSSSSVLVHKVMEARPSWDTSSKEHATNQDTASQSQGRQWPPRRRPPAEVCTPPPPPPPSSSTE